MGTLFNGFHFSVLVLVPVLVIQDAFNLSLDLKSKTVLNLFIYWQLTVSSL